MKTSFFKKSLPYLAGIGLFIVITLVYFSPLLEGKQIYQFDIAQYAGASKELVDFRNQTGQEGLWTNSMFAGMPAYQISVKYTSNLIGYFDKIITLGLPRPADMLFLYMIGFFFLLIVLRVNPWLAIAGAIGFAFSSYFLIILDVGHNSKAVAIGYMAPVLAGIILAFRKKYLWGGLVTAIFLSLELKANHPQISYYLVMMAVILGIAELVESIREKRFAGYLKAIGVIAVASVFALLTNITSIWATYDYSKETIRGKSELSTEKENRTSGLDKDYATQWSYGVGETMTFLVPHLYGGTNLKVGENSAIAKALRQNNVPEENVKQFIDQPLPMYWGPQPFTAGPVYVGAIIFFLFFLGLFIVKGPLKWWLLASTVLSVVLAWGQHFMVVSEFFLNYVPAYNKFRAVSMTLVIAEVAMPLLGILAVKELFNPEKDRKKIKKHLITAFAITGGLSLIFALLPDAFFNFTGANDTRYGFPDWLVQALREDRKSMLQKDAIRSFIFILLSAGILYALVIEKIKAQYAFLLLTALVLIDMYAVDKRYLNENSFTTPSKIKNPWDPSPADLQILQDKDPDYKVLNLTVDFMNDASTSYFHKSLGGYHGAKLRRYQEIVDYCLRNEIQTYAKSMNNENTPVLNMLNTKYIIVPDQNKQPVADRNESALGHAWFVNEVRMVQNPDEEIKAIQNFDPANTAIVEKRFADEVKNYVPSRDSADSIRLTEYKPNYLKYVSSSKNVGLAVFSEVYYAKGWNAYIDGKKVPYLRANYILRSMIVPAGNHEIEFKFEPTIISAGEKISLISSIILLLAMAGGIALEVRKFFRKEA